MAQIMSSLIVAHIMYDFTHYDLHTSNILIKKLDKKIKIPIYGKDFLMKPKYIETDILVKIIDYEHCHFVYRGKHHGKKNHEKYKIYSDKSWPLHDIYKIFMFSSKRIIYSENKYISNDYLNSIYKIFGTGGLINFEKIPDNYKYYHPSKNVKEINYSKFLNLILSELNKIK